MAHRSFIRPAVFLLIGLLIGVSPAVAQNGAAVSSVAELEEQLENLRKQINDAKNTPVLVKIRDDASGFQSKLKRAADDAEDRFLYLQSDREKISFLEDEIDWYMDEIEDIEDEISFLEDEIDWYMDEIKDIEDKIMQNEAQIADIGGA
ncbi:MAG: hypothetical protein GDA49_09055 [Rhodospirillales bacterium]|nr:hypothetical protein [Rhodospirillales bacterium]